MLHEGRVDNGRINCTFSRVVSVLRGSEDSDLNLDSSHYIMIGTGLSLGVCVCVCVLCISQCMIVHVSVYVCCVFVVSKSVAICKLNHLYLMLTQVLMTIFQDMIVILKSVPPKLT